MSPELILQILTVLITLKCIIAFALKSLSAKRFRKKIALPHGFAEGVMTGAAYPLLIITLALTLIQTILFFVLPLKNESLSILRLFIFIIIALIYGYFDRRTPALRAYWFGKNAMYETSNERGKINYADVYGAKVSPKISLPGSTGQQLCKISFFVKDKQFFFGRKKYVCRMTAYAINELANHVEFNNKAHTHTMTPPFRRRALSFVLSVLLTLMTFSIALPLFSYGILNNETYSGSETVSLSAPLDTVSPISELAFIDGKLCVYYKNIEAVEFYNADGSFVYALSFPASGLKSSDFSVKDGSVNYRYGDTLIRHYPASNETVSSKYIIENDYLFTDLDSPVVSNTGDVFTHDRSSIFRKEHGKDVATPFITRSSFVKLFDIESMWILTALLLTLAFVIHFMLADRPKRSARQKHEPKPSSEKGSQINDSLPNNWTA